MMSNASMCRLGDYIRQVDVRNRDLKVTNLKGLSNEKVFIESIANTIGTDFSGYKIILPNQFAYVPVTSRNGDKITIAYYGAKEAAIVSQAYTTFEIIDESALLPEYLMMWFRRPEFDRYSRFKSHGSAREIFDWEEMCDVILPVPPIEEQRKIVARHKAIEHKIDVNRCLIAKLEETARTIYRHTFVENIDPENLPDGWRMGTLADIADICSGKTCSSKQDIKSIEYCFPVAGAAGIIGWSNEFNNDERLLTTGRVGTLGVVNRYDGLTYMADNVLVVKSKHFEFCDQVLKNFDYAEITKGGVQALITQTELSNIELPIPPIPLLEEFEKRVGTLSELIRQYNKEINQLLEISVL